MQSWSSLTAPSPPLVINHNKLSKLLIISMPSTTRSTFFRTRTGGTSAHQRRRRDGRTRLAGRQMLQSLVAVMNTQISVTFSFLSARLYNKRRISAQTYYKRLTRVEAGPHLRHVDHRTHRINCWSRNLRSFNLWNRLLLLRRRDRVATTTMHTYQTHNPTRSHEVSGHIK